MKKIIGSMITLILFPAFLTQADVIMYKDMPETQLQPIIINSKDVPNLHKIDFSSSKNTVKPKNRVWKIEPENKAANASNDKALTTFNKLPQKKYAVFLKAISPEYQLDKNILSLQKVSINRRKQSIMFVFLMNQVKESETNLQQQISGKPHKRMHVMWPGSKFLKQQQRVIDDEYPVDISIANYEDGYAAREWNFVLPNKKPKEVAVALMWSF